MRVVKPINFNALSFERESIATYYNSSGVLVTVGDDVLRLGYNPSTLEYIGPIYEDISFNTILHSNSFTNAIWEKVGSPQPTITANATISPDGTNNAALFSWTSGTTLIRQSLFAGAGPSGIFSVYIKAVSINCSIRLNCGSESSVFRVNSGDFSALSPQASIQKLPNGWFRCSLYNRVFTSTQTVSIQSNNGNFYIYGAQVENIGLPSSWNPPAINYVTSYMLSTTEKGFRAKDIQNTPPSMSSSNVPEDDFPEYNPSATYAEGNRVMVKGAYNRNYRSLSASNFDNFPPDSPEEWLDIGATNRWRMLDNKVGADLQTSATGTVDVTLSVESRVNTVALFNLQGSSATVRMFYDGGVIYEKTVSLLVNVSPPGWWSFWFGEQRQVKVIALTDLPPAVPSSIQIVVDAGSGTAAIGKAVVGFGRDLGFIEYGTTSVGIIDYSTKEVDAFGNYFFQLRRFVDTMDLRVVVEPGQEDTVKATLAEARAQPYVYIGDEGRESLILLGRYIDFTILFSTPASSYCSVQFEGL